MHNKQMYTQRSQERTEHVLSCVDKHIRNILQYSALEEFQHQECAIDKF